MTRLYLVIGMFLRTNGYRILMNGVLLTYMIWCINKNYQRRYYQREFLALTAKMKDSMWVAVEIYVTKMSGSETGRIVSSYRIHLFNLSLCIVNLIKTNQKIILN